MTALRIAGLEPVAVPAIAVELAAPGGDLDRAAASLRRCSWVVVTSANGALAILAAAARSAARLDGPSWAAIGPTTRRALEAAGVTVAHVATVSQSLALAAELPIGGDDRVLVVRGDLAGDDVAVALRARGAAVDDVIGYWTCEAPAGSRGLLGAAVAGGPVAAIVFTSGSTVRGLVGLARDEGLDLAAIPSICIGQTTAAAAREAGFAVVAISATPQATDLAATTVGAVAALAQEVA